MKDAVKNETSHQPDRGRLVRRLGLGLGVLLIAGSMAIVGNVAWQLYGTGIATTRDQHRLGKQFNAAIAGAVARSAGAKVTGHSSAKTSAGSRAADVLPTSFTSQGPQSLGSVLAHLVIPAIGVNDYVVEGVGSSELAEGPGHYPGTAAIGGNGNVAIAGHRTTHTAPFYYLNELVPGDLIYLTNLADRTFTYRVTSQFVVTPSDVAVLNPTRAPSLTLTTCNPPYSAAQRLIVRASLVTLKILGSSGGLGVGR
jgi:sortase A